MGQGPRGLREPQIESSVQETDGRARTPLSRPTSGKLSNKTGISMLFVKFSVFEQAIYAEGGEILKTTATILQGKISLPPPAHPSCSARFPSAQKPLYQGLLVPVKDRPPFLFPRVNILHMLSGTCFFFFFP